MKKHYNISLIALLLATSLLHGMEEEKTIHVKTLTDQEKFYDAVLANDTFIINKLIEAGSVDINHKKPHCVVKKTDRDGIVNEEDWYDLTPLMLAIRNNCNRLTLRTLINAPHHDLLTIDKNGFTAFHHACWKQKTTEALEMLLSHPAAKAAIDMKLPPAPNKATHTSLTLAISQKMVNHVALLCKHGANPNFPVERLIAPVNPDSTVPPVELLQFPIHLALGDFHSVRKKENLIMIRILADAGAHMESFMHNSRDNSSHTALQIAFLNKTSAVFDNYDFLWALIALGADHKKIPADKWKETIHARMFTLDPSHSKPVTRHLFEICALAPLAYSTGMIFLSLHEIVAEGGNPNAHGTNLEIAPYDITPLMWCGVHNLCAHIKVMLNIEPVPTSIATPCIVTLVLYDLNQIYNSYVRSTDNVNKVNVNETDAFGDTALHYAARNGSADAVRLLLSHPRILDGKKNSSNKRPLDLARMNKRDSVVNVFERLITARVRLATSLGKSRLIGHFPSEVRAAIARKLKYHDLEPFMSNPKKRAADNKSSERPNKKTSL